MMAVMELDLLRTYVAVARTGSLNQAAVDLHLSQASVSRRLRRLEAELGVELFRRRDGRSLELTEAGARALDPCLELLADAERRWEQVRASVTSEREQLTIAIGALISALPAAAETAERFRRLHPRVDLRVVEVKDHREALDDVLSGAVDLAINGLPGDAPLELIETVPMFPVCLHVIVPHDHRFARSERVPLAELAQERLAVLDGGSAQAAVVEAAERAGVAIRFAQRCDQSMTLFALLSAGQALPLVYAGLGLPSGPLGEKLRSVPLDVDDATVTVAGYWRRRRPPSAAARTLVELGRELAERLAQR